MHTKKGLVGWPFTSEGAHATHEALRPNADAPHLPARPAALLQRPLPLRAPAARVARDMGDEPRGWQEHARRDRVREGVFILSLFFFFFDLSWFYAIYPCRGNKPG